MKLKITQTHFQKESHTCQNCGNIYKGNVCNICGEKIFNKHQLSASHFLHEVIDFFYHFENKVLKTIKLNFLKPGFITLQNFKGIRVPYARPVQLYLVISLLFYIVVTKVGTTDYIPNFGDHKYFTLSSHTLFSWAKPIDNAINNTIDSAYSHKRVEIENGLLEQYEAYSKQADGSYKIVGLKGRDSTYVTQEQLQVLVTKEARTLRQVLFNSHVKTLGKTLIFLLLPVFALFFFILFYKKIYYYGSALILATHFVIYNMCFYILHSLLNFGPYVLWGEHFGGWLTKPFVYIFYNNYTASFSNYIFGAEFEFIHFLFWFPWLFIAFKRLFNTVWWKNIIITYVCTRIFYFLIYGVLKKIVILLTIWSIH